MSRLSKRIVAAIAMIAFPSLASAHEWTCGDRACFPYFFQPGYPVEWPQNFHPRLRDGVPLVNDFENFPEAYHGVGCVWSWQPVARTPRGLVWGTVPHCIGY
jgi:hypothetical protein